MKLSIKLKMARENKDMTQTDLANASGVSLQSIKRYETDKGNITIDNLQKIAEALDVSMTYFLESNGSTHNTSQHISGNGNIQTSGNFNKIINGAKPSKELLELFNLITDYASPKMIENLKMKLTKIKELHED
jgi:transcriptional regulator with XRE-family HTH domain